MRALARWSALLLLAAPLGAWALGLGDIQLRSALNQPLEADILLVSATPEELEGLRVALASRDTFDLHGVERQAFLSSLDFRVTRDEQGRDVVRITSNRSVSDPFLTLLVEATWPRGRLLREYTLLLDPPLLLPPAAEPIMPAQTQPSPGAPSAPISRPPAEPAAAAPAAPAAPASTPAPRSASAEGTYGPVQRAETLWSIAASMQPSGITLNQMMVAMYEANPQAFDGNMNLLRQGAVLRVPGLEEIQRLNAQAATTLFQRHNEEWQARLADEPRLRLVAAGDDAGASSQSAPSPAASAGAGSAEMARLEGEVSTLRGELAESQRLLELRDEQLAELQARLAAAEAAAETAVERLAEAPVDGAPAPAPAAGADLDTEIFADEVEIVPLGDADSATELVAAADAAAEPEPAAAAEPEPEPAAAPTPITTVAGAPEPETGLLSQVLAWLTAPMLWMGLGGAAVLGAALYFLRQRRAEEAYEDLTGQWDALTAETDEELDTATRENTERLRRQALDQDILVEEPVAGQTAANRAAEPDDDTLSSQTAINLDQADPLAEADFHMAYGLYDQAAELVTKALQSDPSRRDLKLKLLEVYFVWGNKDAFLDAARDLRDEMGGAPDADWDKVMIMGKQLAPDQELFAGATGAAGGALDVDLADGDSPALDLELGEQTGASEALDIGDGDDDGLEFSFDEAVGDETSGQNEADAETQYASTQAVHAQSFDDGDELDIGAMTAAGIEEALLLDGDADDDDETGTRTAAGEDGAAVTQESPTVESPAANQGASDDVALEGFGDSFEEEQDDERWALDPTMESPTMETPGPDDPTMESPGADWPTMETPTVETAGPDAPTVETPALKESGTTELPAMKQSQDGAAHTQETSDYTAEIDLDDLGLDVDLDGLPEELGDVPQVEGGDTREQPRPQQSSERDILSATGITEVLHTDDEDLAAALEEDLAAADRAQIESGAETQLASAIDDSFATTGTSDDEAADLPGGLEHAQTLTGTEVLEEMPEEADTSLVRSLGGNGEVDLDLDDLSAALDGSETVEQPRASSFGGDIFGGNGETPLDLDIGFDGEDASGGSGLDPQTMTEVGTKLDLARAYIDMGDPEGARSILEEVLEEGDPGQRQEAKGLIDSLSA